MAGALGRKESIRYSIIDTKGDLGVLRQRMGAGMPRAEQVYELSMACFERDGRLDGVFGGVSPSCRNSSNQVEEEVSSSSRMATDEVLNTGIHHQRGFEWTREQVLGKIELSMRNSLVVCAAYVEDDDENALQRWVRGLHGERRLVGFGRAVGDTALVATICDVMVHPSYRRRGIGSRILRNMTRHLDTVWDIIDVGAPVHPEAMPFFESDKAHFGEDTEGSIALQLRVHARLIDHTS